MGVSIRVEDELDATFDTLLLVTITDLVEDGVEDLIDGAILSHLDDGFNHLVLYLLFIEVKRSRSRLIRSIKDRIVSILYYYGIYYSLDELNVGVIIIISSSIVAHVVSDVCSCSIHGELSLCLLEHLLLFSCDTLTFSLLLLADESFVFGELSSAALLAPALPLSRSEIIDPTVSLVAAHFDDGLIEVVDDDFDATFVAESLCSDSIDNLDAIVANLVLVVSDLPEGDLAALACLFITGETAVGRSV